MLPAFRKFRAGLRSAEEIDILEKLFGKRGLPAEGFLDEEFRETLSSVAELVDIFRGTDTTGIF